MFALEGVGVGDGEGFVDVEPTVVDVFVSLCVGVTDAAQAGGVDGEPEHTVDAAGYPFGLVEAALLLLLGMERDGDDQVGRVGED